ncbi:MAG: PadR family transcriptional regulator [Acidimicrobiales bacterium]
MAHGLTTTSYAILGLLALKPWTTYELAQQMGRALGQFWPRAESKLYEEPKKLVALGLATADRESVGNRRRTVYSITDDGRQALSRWLPLAGAPPVLEFELLIKVFFAEHGTKDDLLATLGLVRAWTEAQATLGVHITGEYLEGRGPFPERLPWILLTGQFLQDFLNMVERWADRAAATVGPWPDDIRAATPDLGVLEAMAADNRAILERADQRRRASPPAAGQ